MTSPSGPPWASWHRAGATLRLSDAERSAMADTLSRHFADGRLDEAEFAARLDRTMAAKVRADFAGLLDDLPPLRPTEAGPPGQRGTAPRGGQRRLVGLALLVVAVAMLAGSWPLVGLHALFGPVRLVLVVLLVLALWRRRGHRHHRGRRSWAAGPGDRLVG